MKVDAATGNDDNDQGESQSESDDDNDEDTPQTDNTDNEEVESTKTTKDVQTKRPKIPNLGGTWELSYKNAYKRLRERLRLFEDSVGQSATNDPAIVMKQEQMANEIKALHSTNNELKNELNTNQQNMKQDFEKQQQRINELTQSIEIQKSNNQYQADQNQKLHYQQQESTATQALKDQVRELDQKHSSLQSTLSDLQSSVNRNPPAQLAMEIGKLSHQPHDVNEVRQELQRQQQRLKDESQQVQNRMNGMEEVKQEMMALRTELSNAKMYVFLSKFR